MGTFSRVLDLARTFNGGGLGGRGLVRKWWCVQYSSRRSPHAFCDVFLWWWWWFLWRPIYDGIHPTCARSWWYARHAEVVGRRRNQKNARGDGGRRRMDGARTHTGNGRREAWAASKRMRRAETRELGRRPESAPAGPRRSEGPSALK